MSQKYTMTQAAALLGITRRALYDWIRDAGMATGKLPGDERTRALTHDQITRLAEGHGKRLADEGLEQHVKALEARLEALEAWKEEAERKLAQRRETPSAPSAPPQSLTEAKPSPRAMLPRLRQAFNHDQAETAKRPVVTTGAPEPVRWTPLAAVPTSLADWITEHGTDLATLGRWGDLPRDPAEALRFVNHKMWQHGLWIQGQHLHQCSTPGCVCHRVLPTE